MAIRPILWEEIKEKDMTLLYTQVEMPLTSVLVQMEAEGIKLDTPRLQRYGNECLLELNALSQQIRDLCGDRTLNISSPKQLGIVLFEKLKLDPNAKLTPGKQYATDEETLLSLESKHPIIPLLLEYRSLNKLLSTYIDPLPGLLSRTTGRIHTTFNQTLTATGRLSSQRPNMQNIPIREERGKELRRVFVPRSADYQLLSADYSQIELRVMAHLSQDQSFIDAFQKGEDIHIATAAKIFNVALDEVTREQRNRAKTANFGIIYGISSFGLAQRLHISRTEAKALIDGYFLMYPKVREYIDAQIESAKAKGYVTTLMNRRRYLSDINSRNNTIRSLAERNAVNAPIQGSAADIIKIAMVNISKKIEQNKLRSRMILQVHDELVFDLFIPEKEELISIVKTLMEQSVSLSVPLIADCGVGNHWLEAH
jgi:DNA polymerase-1